MLNPYSRFKKKKLFRYTSNSRRFTQPSIKNDKDNHLILVEHDHVYTLGKNANSTNVLNRSCEIIQTQRGGDVTYHGPGQLVAYPIINLKKRKLE